MTAKMVRKKKSVSQRTNATALRIEQEGWTFLLESGKLLILHRDEVQVELPLSPRSGSKRFQLGPWRKVDAEHFKATVGGLGTAHIAVREGHVAFWMETKTKQFESLSYFPGTTFNGDRWQSYVSDEWDRLWDKNRDQEVGISSAYRDMINVFQSEPGGMPDPRDFPPTYVWNIPAKAFSLKTNAGYVGFSIPGALPVGTTRLSMKDRLFSLSFDLLRPACTDGTMPVVYIVPGLAGAYDVLDEHRVISEKLGLTKKKTANHPQWWTKPCYKASLEYIRRWQEIDRGIPWTQHDQSIKDKHMEIMTQDNFRSWIMEVKKSIRADEMNVMFEQGVFRIYGDYTPITTMGGTKGFRSFVDELRQAGVHVCYYIHPFMVNAKIDFFQKHPEALCKPIDKKTALFYNTEHLYDPDPKFGLLDWTHPLGRKYLLDQVEYILSSKKGSLDCDWLRSNHWRGPDPRYYTFHDPDWGIGDMMSLKAQKAIYEKAKKVKPHCCVSKASMGDPYMQPYADADLLCEDHTPFTHRWYERGDMATRLLKDMIFITDPWQVSITKATEYYMAMAVWCTNEVPDVNHAIHPYTCFLPMKEPRDYNRRRAGVAVQANAPLNATDLVRVERPTAPGETPTIWRKRTQGPLAGWFASFAISKNCFVSYSETEARVASTETRYVQFPLPPGAKVGTIEKVPQKGKPQAMSADLTERAGETWVDMKVEDAGNGVLYYRVKYKVSKS